MRAGIWLIGARGSVATTTIVGALALRAGGLLRVYTQAGMEYLDPWTSRAFAVADHQIAQVYVADPADLAAVRKVCAALPGVAEVLDGSGQAVHGLDHPRAGELVLVAEPDAWFTYYYWLDDARAPDFARLVEIHRKPGYDPAELFFDPAAPSAARRCAAVPMARKKLGMRYLMSVVGLDAGAAAVRGSHGRLPDDPDDSPVLLCSSPQAGPCSLRGDRGQGHLAAASRARAPGAGLSQTGVPPGCRSWHAPGTGQGLPGFDRRRGMPSCCHGISRQHDHACSAGNGGAGRSRRPHPRGRPVARPRGAGPPATAVAPPA